MVFLHEYKQLRGIKMAGTVAKEVSFSCYGD